MIDVKQFSWGIDWMSFFEKQDYWKENIKGKGWLFSEDFEWWITNNKWPNWLRLTIVQKVSKVIPKV